MKKNYSDIDYFTKAYNPGFMSDNLVFLTEDMESFDTMLCDKVRLKKNKFKNRNFLGILSCLFKSSTLHRYYLPHRPSDLHKRGKCYFLFF